MVNAILIEHYKRTGKQLRIVKEHDLNFEVVPKIKKGFLCVDDIGRNQSLPRDRSLLGYYYELFDYKYERKQKMIVTSNYDVPGWLEKMVNSCGQDGVEAISDRFSGTVSSYNLTGESRRGKG